jgi:amino acid transporter
VGWGTDNLAGFINSRENPTFVLARGYWGGAWVIVLLALLNSVIAAAIAGNSAATRVWFGMARSGSLPRALAKVHPKYKTPVNGVKLQILLTFAVGLGLGWWIGPGKEFEFMGTLLTFALILTFSAANLGVFLYYFRERRDEFSVVLHAIFPLVGTVALFFVAYSSLRPWPPPPIGYTPLVVAIWLALGLLVLLVMKLAGKEEWLIKAGQVTQERAETDEEVSHRPMF